MKNNKKQSPGSFAAVTGEMIQMLDSPLLPDQRLGKEIPLDMKLVAHSNSGVYLGAKSRKALDQGHYVGKSARSDGNIMVLGTNGSGKSRFIAKSTLQTWHGPIVALDIKGELSSHYRHLFDSGRVQRQYVIFDPANGGISFDPFALLNREDLMLVQFVREIAFAIIPKPPDIREPHWIDTARDLLSAAILYGFENGLSFIETMSFFQMTPAGELCKEITVYGSETAQMLIGELKGLKPQHLADIASEAKLNTLVFATDPAIRGALKKCPTGEPSFSWADITDDQDAPHVFLCMAQDRLEQWGGVIRLILTQLVRQLERRPDRYTSCGRGQQPILILLDEFPLLGKMEIISNALTTLRSKGVTFCLMLQSLPQLDAVYDSNVRRILVDNCQYKAILSVTEPDSQRYISELLGMIPAIRRSASASVQPDWGESVYNCQIQETREPLVYPEELAENEDIILHTPFGFVRTRKLPVNKT